MSEDPKPRRIRRRWIVLFAIIALCIVFRVALPYGIQWAAASFLEGQGVTVETGPEISLGIFKGRAQIENLMATHSSGAPIAVGHIHADLSWRSLFQGQIVFEHVEIGAVDAEFELDDAGGMFVSGIPIPEGEPPPPDAKPIQYEIRKLDIAASRLGIAIQEYKAALGIDQLGLEHLGNIAPEERALVDFIIHVDEAPVTVGGHATPFLVQVGSATNVKIESLDLAPFEQWFRAAGIYEPAGHLSIDLDIDANYHQETQEIELRTAGTVHVDQFALRHSDFDSPSISLLWDGDVSAIGPLDALVIGIDGKLDLDPMEASLPKSDIILSTKDLDWEGAVQVDPAADQSLVVNGTLALLGGNVYIGSGEEMQSVGFSDLKTVVEPFARSDDGAFNTKGSVALNTAAFSDSDGAVWASAGGLDVNFDLAATAGDNAELTGDSIIKIQEASANIGEGDEMITAHVTALDLNANQFATPLGGENPYVRATPTLSIANARAENARGFDADVSDIQFTGQLDVDGETVVAGDATLGKTTFASRADAMLNGAIEKLAVVALGVYANNSVAAQTLKVNGVAALDTLDPVKKKHPKSVTLQEITVDEFAAGATGVVAEAIGLTNLNVVVQRRKDGSLAHAQAAAEEAPSEASTETDEALIDEMPADTEEALAEETNEAESSPFRVAVGQFTLQGENTIRFHDASLESPVSMVITPLTIDVSAIDTAASTTPAKFDINAGVGEFGEIGTSGAMTLDPAKPTGNITTTISSVDLIPFDPYTQRYIGYRLLTGKLDYDMTLAMDAGQIDADSDVALLGFMLERLSDSEKDEFTEQLGLPINTALSLLRDADDAIRLSIPITGDITSPSFGIGDAIRKATFNAMKSGVTAVFAPIGIVIGAANQVSFDPIPFAAGSSELSPDAIEQLALVAELMKKRPNVKLRLCGAATRSEIKAAGVVPPLIAADDPDAGTLLSPDFKPEEDSEDEADLPGTEGLMELATARAKATIGYLMAEQGIEHERLFECAPRVDTESDAKPRVVLAL